MVRSAPTQNVSLSEVMTAPLIAASFAIVSTIAESSSITFKSIPFIARPGASQLTSAMPSASVSSLKLAMALRLLRVRLARPVRKTKTVLVLLAAQIDIGIVRALLLGARAHLGIGRVARGLVGGVMAVGDAGLEPRRVARSQHRRAAILDQRDLPLEHIDELVLGLVPMAQRRRSARLEPRQIDAELHEPRDVAERRLLAAVGDAAPRLRIGAFGADGCVGDIDLGHRGSPSLNPESAHRTCGKSGGWSCPAPS